MQVCFGKQVARTTIYAIMCPFPLSVALCDQNPPTLHRQSDRRTSYS